MPKLSINLEYTYTEYPTFQQRISAAARDGFKFVEIFYAEGKNIPEMAQVARELGIQFASVVASPRFNFSLPGADLDEYFEGFQRSLEVATELGCPRLVVTSGVGFPGAKRQVQLDHLVEVFSKAADLAEPFNIDVVFEAANTRVDHPGVLVDTTADAVYVVNKVNKSNFLLQYDIYHSIVMGEDPFELLEQHKDIIGYIQIADAPGRGEPGTGEVDFKKIFKAIDGIGYPYTVGLEIYPTKESSAALQYARTLDDA